MENGKPVILILDSPMANLELTQLLLQNHYKVKITDSAETALTIATASPPDLILISLTNPAFSGFDICRRMKTLPALIRIPLIFLANQSDFTNIAEGLALGAVDYIPKPFDPALFLTRIHTHITLKQTQDFLKDKNNYLETEISQRIKEMAALQEITIVAMASLAETRDHETTGHIQRVSEYIRELALELRPHKRFRHNLTPETIRLLVKSAPLHDIGKIGIPDRILLKPSALAPEEFEIIKTHTQIGRQAIDRAEAVLGMSDPLLDKAKEIAYFHHEKWNGAGYPEGLSGDKIPLSARLMAVADVYDALTSKRIYKEPVSHETAVQEIVAESGKHFDPDIVAAFLSRSHRFEEISQILHDSPTQQPEMTH
ncbi:MAG: HD domain-containing protein [Sporomusaceae bacterium]|nr:HD domain-containing protein [Sporomusaceae bacterium]